MQLARCLLMLGLHPSNVFPEHEVYFILVDVGYKHVM